MNDYFLGVKQGRMTTTCSGWEKFLSKRPARLQFFQFRQIPWGCVVSSLPLLLRYLIVLSVCVTLCLLPFEIHAKFSSLFECSCPCTKQLMMAQFQLANTQKLLCETIRSAFIFQRESAERINTRKRSMTWEGRRTGNERQICCVYQFSEKNFS